MAAAALNCTPRLTGSGKRQHQRGVNARKLLINAALAGSTLGGAIVIATSLVKLTFRSSSVRPSADQRNLGVCSPRSAKQVAVRPVSPARSRDETGDLLAAVVARSLLSRPIVIPLSLDGRLWSKHSFDVFNASIGAPLRNCRARVFEDQLSKALLHGSSALTSSATNSSMATPA
jgi:hypothetical protein